MPKVPDAILNKLRCTNCKFWISCGPVRVLPDGGSACGRCINFAAADQYRHFAYEAMSCYFEFPCKYWENHCHEGLLFKEVMAHESECSYKPGCCFCCCHPFIACRSSRKLDIEAAIQLEIVPEQILDYLRCSICAGYLSSTPVLVAKDGTSICHRCSTQHTLLKNSEYRRHVLYEAFANMMIFPCVFRYEGCVNLYKFGEPMQMHETECLYNGNRNQDSRSQPRVYGSVTPNAAWYALTAGKRLEKEMFSEEFQRHKETLATKWSHHQELIALQEIAPKARLSGVEIKIENEDVITAPPELRRAESVVKNNIDFPTNLIDELKLRQSFRRNQLTVPEDNRSVVPSSSSNGSFEQESQGKLGIR